MVHVLYLGGVHHESMQLFLKVQRAKRGCNCDTSQDLNKLLHCFCSLRSVCWLGLWLGLVTLFPCLIEGVRSK